MSRMHNEGALPVDELESVDNSSRYTGPVRHGRRSWLLPAAAALSVAALAAAAFGAREIDRGPKAPAADGETTTWLQAGVPWVDKQNVHFAGQQAPRPVEVMSVAATADAAFVAGGDHGAVVALDILTSAGEHRTVDEQLTGIPIADPAGNLAAWTAMNADGENEVVAYDSTTGQVAGTTKVAEGVKVYWVDGDSVFYSDGNEKHFVWKPGSADASPIKLATAEEGIVTDHAATASFEVAASASSLVGPSGDVLKRFDGFQFGTFSPDGRWLALTRDKGLKVWDVTGSSDVALPLPTGQQVTGARWSAKGDLIVEAVPVTADDVPDPTAPVRYFLCVPSSASCAALPTLDLDAGDADGLESSAAGQFATLVG